MSQTPKVSVLMPVYNTPEEFLRPAIESILNQTFSDFEFLILDDGSTNNAGEIIEEYAKKDTRVRALRHEANKNVAKSRNDLLENANGVYVAYMDSDDLSSSDRLQKQYDYLEKNKEVSILGTYIEILDGSKLYVYPENIKYIDILRGCQIANNTIMMRLEDIKKYNLKYSEDFVTAEDYEFWSRAVRYLKICTLKEVLVKYRTNHPSLSTVKRALTLKNDELVKNAMLEFLTDDSKLRKKIRKLVEVKEKYTFWQRIFSIRNMYYKGKKYKLVRFLGLILKFEREMDV